MKATQMLENGLAVLDFARRNTLSFLEDIPEDKWCHQPVPNANHALWIAAHLAHTDNYFLVALGGREPAIPKEWDEMFGMGSKPHGDMSRYPSPAEIRQVLGERRESLQAWFRSLDEDNRLAEAVPEDWKSFAPNYIGMAHSLAWHEGMHAGQLTVIRKSLGMGPKFA